MSWRTQDSILKGPGLDLGRFGDYFCEIFKLVSNRSRTCSELVPNMPWTCPRLKLEKDENGCSWRAQVFNYNTLEKIHEIEAHMDYMRCVCVHSTLPYVLTSSDDMTIKCWNWEKNWNNEQVFEGHAHYVMMVQWIQKNSHIFASFKFDLRHVLVQIFGST